MTDVDITNRSYKLETQDADVKGPVLEHTKKLGLLLNIFHWHHIKFCHIPNSVTRNALNQWLTMITKTFFHFFNRMEHDIGVFNWKCVSIDFFLLGQIEAIFRKNQDELQLINIADNLKNITEKHFFQKLFRFLQGLCCSTICKFWLIVRGRNK